MQTIRRPGRPIPALIILLVVSALACKGSGASAKDAAPRPEAGGLDATGEPAVEDGGGHPDALGDVPVAPPDSSTDTTTVVGCDWPGVFNEGSVFAYPEFQDGDGDPPCLETPCAFDFTISDQRNDDSTADNWHFSLLGTGTLGPWTVAWLGVFMPLGWDVTWSTGQTVGVRNVVRGVFCPSARMQEYPVQAHLSLRDAAGKLLLLNAADVPLAPNGEVMLEPTFAPEVSVAWRDIGCPAYAVMPSSAGEGDHKRVAVVVRDTATGSEAMAGFGRNARLQIRGEPYVLAVGRNWIFADGVGCGQAGFTLYREGYLYRP